MEVQATQPSLKHIYTEEKGYPVPEKKGKGRGLEIHAKIEELERVLTSIHSIQTGWRT